MALAYALILQPQDFRVPIKALSCRAQTGQFSDEWLNENGIVLPDYLTHMPPITYAQADGSSVVSQTMAVFTAPADGVIDSITVFNTVAPTGGDRQFTVDVKKSTGGGAFATVLDSVVTRNSSDADRGTETADLVADPSYVAGDSFHVVVTASGSSGTQGQGVLVQINYKQAGV